MSAVAATTGFVTPVQSRNADFFSVSDARSCRYWPCDLLSAFTLQMACQGIAVSTSMMLGSRDYAMEKLTQAQTLNDQSLRELSARMFAYFDDEPCHAATLLAAQGAQNLQSH